jgi:hypothetical protein
VLNTTTAHDEIDSKDWIGRSGASYHYYNSKEGLYNCTIISVEITVRNGNRMIAMKVGNLRSTVQQKNGEKIGVILQSVKFAPDLWMNLYSLSTMKGNTTLYVERILNTKNGLVSGIKLIPMIGNMTPQLLNQVTRLSLPHSRFSPLKLKSK